MDGRRRCWLRPEGAVGLEAWMIRLKPAEQREQTWRRVMEFVMNGEGTGSVRRKEVSDGLKDGKPKYDERKCEGSEARQGSRKA